MNPYFYLVVVLILINLGCEKSNDDVNDNPYKCSASTFNIQIQKDITSIAIAEDKENNVYVLASDNPGSVLYKLDKNGSIIWEKDSLIMDNIPAQLIVLENNTIVVLSYTENEVDSNQVTLIEHWLWLQNGYWEVSPCQPTYEMGDEKIWEYSVRGETILTGLNADGDILWSNTYDKSFCEGKSLWQDENEDGVTLSRRELLPLECSNLMFSMTGNQESLYISGMYKTRNPSTYQIEEHPYFKKLDETGNIVWTYQNARVTGHFNIDRFISEENGELTVINKDGIELWTVPGGYTSASIVNCAKGVTAAFSNFGSISVIRTNLHGVY